MDPMKSKYHSLYWAIAHNAAQQSTAKRGKVGCVIVAPSGMLSIGWNGMPAGYGWGNECEYMHSPGPDQPIECTTKPEVIHAERNAIDKMTRQGASTEGSIMFTTMAPCLECAKSIHGLGFKQLFYLHKYRDDKGLNFLNYTKVQVIQDLTVSAQNMVKV